MSAQTLIDEVLDLLAGGEALTTREIYAQATMASETDQVSKAIHVLRKRGEVALAPGLDESGQRRYCLAAQGEPETAMPSPEAAAAVVLAEAAEEQGAADTGKATASPAAKARRGVKARGVRAGAGAGAAADLPAVSAPDLRWAALQERRMALAERAMAVVEMILHEERKHGLA